MQIDFYFDNGDFQSLDVKEIKFSKIWNIKCEDVVILKINRDLVISTEKIANFRMWDNKGEYEAIYRNLSQYISEVN